MGWFPKKRKIKSKRQHKGNWKDQRKQLEDPLECDPRIYHPGGAPLHRHGWKMKSENGISWASNQSTHGLLSSIPPPPLAVEGDKVQWFHSVLEFNINRKCLQLIQVNKFKVEALHKGFINPFIYSFIHQKYFEYILNIQTLCLH